MPNDSPRAAIHAIEYQDVHVAAHVVLSNEHRPWNDMILRVIHNHQHGQHSVPAVHEDIIVVRLGGITDLQSRIVRSFPRFQSKPGDIMIFPHNVPSELTWTTPSDNLQLILSPSLLSSVAAEVGDMDPTKVELIDQIADHDPLIYDIGNALLAEVQSTQSLSRLYAESLTHTLAVHLLRHHAAFPPAVQTLKRGLGSLILKRVLDYINDNLAQELTLAEIATVAHISPYHFTRLFKQSTGKAVHQYVIERRVDAAKRLLLDGRLSVSDVAVIVGFHDQSHLHRHFKRIIGVSPSALLEQRKNVQEDRKNIQDSSG